MKFRCICGKEFEREEELRKHIIGFTRGIIRWYPDEHAAVKVDLDVRKIFQEMPIVPENNLQIECRVNQTRKPIVGVFDYPRKKVKQKFLS